MMSWNDFKLPLPTPRFRGDRPREDKFRENDREYKSINGTSFSLVNYFSKLITTHETGTYESKCNTGSIW